MYTEMRRDSYLFSALLHLTLVLLAVFGLPQFWREPPVEETPLVVDLVPLGEKTNPPPLQDNTVQPEPSKAEPEPPRPEPPKPEPPKPTPPQPPAPTPPPPPEPPRPEPPRPEPKPEPAPTPVPKPEPKPEPPKPEPKPEPPKKQKDVTQELDSLLKSVEKKKPTPRDELDKLLKSAETLKPTQPADRDATQTTPQAVRGSASNNPMEPVSMTEKDRIRAHIEKFWNVPAGAKDADKLVVIIRVSVLPDGTVTSAEIESDPVMMLNPYYQAAADSARRAVRAASPLPIPANKYDQFKDFQLAFNPKFAAGR